MYYLILINLLGFVISQSRLDCRIDTLNTCTKIADPLLQHPRYVFPAATEDVDHVCNVLFPATWSEFVTCIKKYTNECLTAGQRSEFNRAVGDSINSVHKMCTNDAYKQDYLQNAECIKEKATTEVYCGRHYSSLVNMVKGVTPSTQRELCCSHSTFKSCVLHETRACRGQGGSGQMLAQDFARAMLDKSLGFLLNQCQDYIPSQADCPGYDIPQVEMEKMPKKIEEKADGYYPSGDGDQRIPGQKQGKIDPIDMMDGGWTQLNPLNSQNIAPNYDDDLVSEQGEKLLPPNDAVDDYSLEPLDPVTESSNYNSVRTDIGDPRPRSEDENTWNSQRKPWLPDISKDIKPFDDLFGNIIDSSFADARTGAGSNIHINNSILICLIINAIILLWA